MSMGLTDELIREFRDSVHPCMCRFKAYGHSWNCWQVCMDAQVAPDWRAGDSQVRMLTRTLARELVARAVSARAKKGG